MTIPRDEVLWFAKCMEKKLQANDHKGHWSNCTLAYLKRRIREELSELERAVPRDGFYSFYTSEEVANIVSEAADVANFAMMIADKARASLRTDKVSE
jgi:NTP pyrophosphatase (non-canonical NTP hydrolase)